MWIPAQIGLGAPYWRRDMRGAWLGIGLETEPAHLVYAVLEGIALRVAQIVRAMIEDSGLPVNSLRVDGGLAKSQTLMQLQADLLGVPVEVLADSEATARGVCYLAARQMGLWSSDDSIKSHTKSARAFEPATSVDHRETRLAQFDRTIQQLQGLS
jgi:glycerol kinase